MGLVDKIRNYAVSKGYYKDDINDIDIDNYDDDYDDMDDVEVVRYKEPRRSKPAADSRMTLPPIHSREERKPMFAASPDLSENPRVRSISQGIKRSVHHAEPKSIEEAGEICDNLLNDSIVSLNFESVDLAASQRVVDFLSGAAYALGGSIHATGSRNFIVLPRNSEMSGQIEEEIRSKGLFFNYRAASK